MKFKHLLTLAFIVLLSTMVSAQKKSEITTAEEMVVYNKQHNKPQYNGLIVVYNYQFQNASSIKMQDLLGLARGKFTNVLKAELRKVDGKDFLTITTEGSLDNNKLYYELLRSQKTFLIQDRRELLLK